MNANGLVVFHAENGRLYVLPETDLSQFDAAICNVTQAPADWSGPAGPASCT
jgi:hypothetical protein